MATPPVTPSPFIVHLEHASGEDARRVGGKALQLARLGAAGFRVPRGFCVTVDAYDLFVARNALVGFLQVELGRKPLDDMRWEELWDTALRIRSAFLGSAVPLPVLEDLRAALAGLRAPLAVRSSAPEEDSASRSFAGLHESVTGVEGEAAVVDALRIVWASLWSDAALLYRREMGLDPLQSRMAVVVQEMVVEDRSGVAFGCDPRDGSREVQIVEAVPGPCALLVDGAVDPDRWVLRRIDGSVLSWQGGQREDQSPSDPLLGTTDLADLHEALQRVEQLLGSPPDVEWTGRSQNLTLLQARAITTAIQPAPDDRRAWYLTLRPGHQRLATLRKRVVDVLIPDLRTQGERLAAESLEGLRDEDLAVRIQERTDTLAHWRAIYESDFIPFAHGARTLGVVYNDVVRPSDPYEFVGLLEGQDLLAARRNRALAALARTMAASPELQDLARSCLDTGGPEAWQRFRSAAPTLTAGGEAFASRFEEAMACHMDTSFQGARLQDQPAPLLHVVWELSRKPDLRPVDTDAVADRAMALEQRFFTLVAPERRAAVEEILETARLSWRLRDDDNVLLGRLESQLVRALREAERRLREGGRWRGGPAGEAHVPVVLAALRSPTASVDLPEAPTVDPTTPSRGRPDRERPRQLPGQAASPGIASGPCRIVTRAEDIGRFRAGEVLVCDAIQPTMTHLVPLAAAIVERRGGMLIHGAIIARETGIPCVNGVVDATRLLEEGELVTVDGYLGLVTVGEPELDLEQQALPSQAARVSPS